MNDVDQLLVLISIVRTDNGRFAYDQRRKVNSVLASYQGSEDRREYRKMFTSYGEPLVPNSGTHEELNALREQF